MTTKTWNVQILLGEDEDVCRADAVLEVQGKTEIRGHGTSRRNPEDPSVPMIGEELAIARALADLGGKLAEAANRAIASHESRHLHLIR